jgi:hypothetical protein
MYSFDCRRFSLRSKKQQKRIKCYKGRKTQTNARTVKNKIRNDLQFSKKSTHFYLS